MTGPASSGSAQAAFLEELGRLRAQAGFNARELAEHLGIEASAVTRAEAGTRRVGVVELQRWTFACGSSLEEFGRRLEARILQ